MYYGHLAHLTGETSHFFVVSQTGDRLTVLQSAVFEYSLRDWLRPAEARAELLASHAAAVADLRPGDSPLDRARLEHLRSALARDLGVLERIEGLPHGAGRELALADFERGFLAGLAELEGAWTEADAGRRCATYSALFACRLDVALVRGLVRLGCEPARLAFTWAPPAERGPRPDRPDGEPHRAEQEGGAAQREDSMKQEKQE